MTETLPGSKQLTPVTTPSSGDTINALTNLSEAKAPISLTLTIDKSVGKIAAWVIGVIVGSAVLIGAGIVLAIWMIIAYTQADRDARMVEYYIHELDGKLISAGFIKDSQRFDKARIEQELERSRQETK